MLRKKHDLYNVSVTFISLETNLPTEKKHANEAALLSLVFKRGQNQRNETQLIHSHKMSENEVTSNKHLYN